MAQCNTMVSAGYVSCTYRSVAACAERFSFTNSHGNSISSWSHKHTCGSALSSSHQDIQYWLSSQPIGYSHHGYANWYSHNCFLPPFQSFVRLYINWIYLLFVCLSVCCFHSICLSVCLSCVSMCCSVYVSLHLFNHPTCFNGLGPSSYLSATSFWIPKPAASRVIVAKYVEITLLKRYLPNIPS